jgi:hypothetical protein
VVKKATKKVAAKKAAKKVAFKSSSSGKFLTIEGEMRGRSFVSKRGEGGVFEVRGNLGQATTFAVKSDKPIITSSIKKFVLYFFNNLRKLICPKAGTKPTLSTGGQAAITAIAVWAGALGLAAHVATSLASAALILIATATKGAFCDMTAEMAKTAIRKA